MNINKATIVGNLTRDPELRRTASGMAVLSFSVAVNERRKNNQTGQWEDYPNFIDCTMFGARAESISRYLHKGSKVAIEGKLRQSRWEKDGQKYSKVGINVDEIELMSAPQNTQQAAPQQPQYAPQIPPQMAPQQPQYTPPQAPQAQVVQPQIIEVEAAPAPSIYDEDIPF